MRFLSILTIVMFTLVSCDRPQTTEIRRLTVGVVSYGEKNSSLQQYEQFKNYLAVQQNSSIELEPTFNEVRALAQISANRWDLVFAPPGLATIAISQYNYDPLVPLDSRDKSRSVIVANSNSTIQTRRDLAGKTIALGQKGSATGYYLPIFNLYGLNFSEVVYASTPKNLLELIDRGEAEVGALSLEDYNILKRNYEANRFKIIYLDKHNIPAGAILISDRLERNQQEQISIALKNAPSSITSEAGYLPNEQVPDYTYLMKVIKRAQEIIATSPVIFQ